MNSDARERIEAWLKAHEKPSIHFDFAKVSAPLPIGASKMGGCPDVPAGFEWPRFKGAEDIVEPERANMQRPLVFMMQLDMAEVCACDPEGLLPKAGHLAFFYDDEGQCWGELEHKGCARVFYFPPEAALQRMAQPDDIVSLNDLPDFELKISCTPRASRPEYMNLPEELLDIMDDELSEEFWPTEDEDRAQARHDCRMLGWPVLIQNPMEEECQMRFMGLDWDAFDNPQTNAAIQKGAADWLLLLQIPTFSAENDGESGVLFGDAGTIYYWIRKQDLVALDFSNIWLSGQW